MKLLGRMVFFAMLILATASTAAANVNYVFYTVESVKWGTAEQQIALPRTYPSQADLTPSAVASEAFHKLQSYRGSSYAGTELTLDPSFQSTGSATVTLGEAAQSSVAVVVSEIYWTLKAAGVREVRIPAIGREPLSDGNVPFGASLFVAELWQALPPSVPGFGFVVVGDQLMPAHVVRQRLESRDRALSAAVVSLLQSPVPYVRLQAVQAVRALGVPRADAALLPLLQDPDLAVKMAVLEGFQGNSSRPVLAALETVVQTDPNASAQSAAARILSAAGVSRYAVVVLYDKLKDPDDAVVMTAIQELGASGKPEVAMALVDVLSHRNNQAQQMAMEAIVALANKDALRKIVETDGFGENFRSQAAELLSADTGETAEIGLRHLLLHGASEKRVWAIEQVASRRIFKLVTDVIGALAGDDSAVRLAAAETLAAVKDSKALPALAQALRDHTAEAEAYENAIVAVFSGLSIDEVIRFSSSEDQSLRRLSIKSLAAFSQGGRAPPKVMDVLKARLADTDLAIRRSAAFALARISDSAVVNSLIALKADPDEEIRMQVAVSVAASQHPDANTILMEYIEDSSSDVRRTAVDGLRERGVTDALAKLRFHVQNRDVGVRRAVLRATVELAGADGWEAWFPIWSNALYDADPEVKISAINGIVYRATDARVPSLIGGLATDPSPEVQQAALKALGATGAKAAIEYVARALFEGNADSKRAALEALAAINIEECRKPIQDFVRVESDPALQERANAIYDNLP